ncbi:MAG: bifunctional [glutamate--ammonia ligase]-adenylyl-L-tyrosine phosphorylase/[glutamate--ammonia-ligase] adenylyltransferase, partial [Burkholderiales bacterium]
MSLAPIPPPLEPSRYARHVLEAQPALAAELAAPQPFTRAQMDAALNGAREDDEAALKRRLRRLRQRVLLRVMARDLSGAAELAEVCGAMSDLAEASIAAALAWAEAGQAAQSGR